MEKIGESIEKWRRLPYKRSAELLSLITSAACIVSALLIASCAQLPDESKNLVLNGRLEADETYLRSKVASVIKKVHVKEGDLVHRGDPIIELDSSELDAKLQKANRGIHASKEALAMSRKRVAALNSKVAELKMKSDSMLTRMFTSKEGRAKKAQQVKEQMIEARTSLELARRQLAELQGRKQSGLEARSYFTMKSPVDGRISVISVSVEEEVKPGQVLVSVMDPDSIYFRSRITGSDKERLSLDKQGTLVLSDKPNEKLKVKVVEIASQPAFTPEHISMDDENERSKLEYPVKLSIISKNDGLAPGDRGEVEVSLSEGTEN